MSTSKLAEDRLPPKKSIEDGECRAAAERGLAALEKGKGKKVIEGPSSQFTYVPGGYQDLS